MSTNNFDLLKNNLEEQINYYRQLTQLNEEFIYSIGKKELYEEFKKNKMESLTNDNAMVAKDSNDNELDDFGYIEYAQSGEIMFYKTAESFEKALTTACDTVGLNGLKAKQLKKEEGVENIVDRIILNELGEIGESEEVLSPSVDMNDSIIEAHEEYEVERKRNDNGQVIENTIMQIDNDLDVRNRTFSNCEFVGEFESVDFRGATFEKCNMDSVQMHGCEFDQATFSQSNISKSVFKNSSFRSAKFEEGSIDTESIFIQNDFSNVVFNSVQGVEHIIDQVNVKTSKKNRAKTI